MGSIRLSEKQRLKYCYSGVYAIIEKYQNKYPDAIVQERSGWKVTGRRRRNQNPLYDVWPLHLTLCSTRQGMMLWIIKELYEKLTVTTCYLHPISGLLKTRREYKFSTQGDCCTFLKDTLWLNPENTDVTFYRFIINGMLDLANQRNVCEVEGGKSSPLRHVWHVLRTEAARNPLELWRVFHCSREGEKMSTPYWHRLQQIKLNSIPEQRRHSSRDAKRNPKRNCCCSWRTCMTI